MRLIFYIILLAIAGIVGWVMGSLHPAPQGVVTPVEQFLSSSNDSLNEALPHLDEPQDVDAPDETPTEPEPAAETPVPNGGGDSGSTLDQYRTWISEARAEHPYPESADRMYAVMMCESGGQADIVNPAGPYSGLFQYANGTWNGDWNTYRDGGVFNARAQIFATALAWSLDMQSQWGCYTHPR